MEENIIANNDSVNSIIYQCFEYLDDDIKKIFIRKFKEHPHDLEQIMHTLRELILGSFLSSSGFKVKYDYKYCGKTPDWCVFNNNSNIIGIIELTNIHIDAITEKKIKASLVNGSVTSYWRDENADNIKRLYQNIENKAQVYKNIASQNCLPYIIAIHFDFFFTIDYEDELKPCLLNNESGLFIRYPELSEIIVIEIKNSSYYFRQFINPYALYSLKLSDGFFPNK